jgi:hypothetical protein
MADTRRMERVDLKSRIQDLEPPSEKEELTLTQLFAEFARAVRGDSEWAARNHYRQMEGKPD